MEIFYTLSLVVLSMAVSLGVGSSTIAICNFFKAIADGVIDETERAMMGVTYIVLRVAMVLILVMYATQFMYGVAGVSTIYYGTTVGIATGVLILTLYANAVLMTYRIMPSTFGPAIQAGSWYSLGIMLALLSQGVVTYSLATFAFAYLAVLSCAVAAVNLGMVYLKHRPKSKS
jgi:hypothetical protein